MKRSKKGEIRRMVRVGVMCLVLGMMAGGVVDAAKDFWSVLYDGPIREAVCRYDRAAVWQLINRPGC